MAISQAIIFVSILIGDQAAPIPAWKVISKIDGTELRYIPPQLTGADYPARARREEEQGTSVLRLQVDPSGHITSCSTARSSGSSELDARACLLYRSRARFELKGTTQSVIVLAPMEWRLDSGESPHN